VYNNLLAAPANCAHLLDFNAEWLGWFYAAFNNASPQKSHPPIYNAKTESMPHPRLAGLTSTYKKYQPRDAQCSMLNAGCWMLDSGSGQTFPESCRIFVAFFTIH